MIPGYMWRIYKLGLGWRVCLKFAWSVLAA